jgi:hypothetical protein
MINLETGAWRGIAAQASTEMDHAKLSSLVEQLCREMDRENQMPAITASFDTNRPTNSSIAQM